MTSDYEVGYGKPPRASQFKPGISGNKKGRPPRRPPNFAAMITDVMNAPIPHREGGQSKSTPGWELSVNMDILRALSGDVDAAMAVLRFWIKTTRSKTGTQRVVVEDWLPDFPGQTAEEKTRAFANRRNAIAVQWWARPGQDSADRL